MGGLFHGGGGELFETCFQYSPLCRRARFGVLSSPKCEKVLETGQGKWYANR